MQDTVLNEVSNGSPASCLWQGKLVVAWPDANRGGAISIAVGDAVTDGPYAPSVVALPFIASGFGRVALATFANEVWLGWMDAPTGALTIAATSDGATFGTPVAVVASAIDGPSLHGGDRLWMTWIEDGSRRMVVASSADGLSFTSVNLANNADDSPAITSFDHPYLGKRVALCWNDGTATFASSAPAGSPQALDATPLRLPPGATPSMCFAGPPASVLTGPTVAQRANDRLALVSIDIDVQEASSVRLGPAISYGPAVVAAGADLLLAYRSAATDQVGVGSWADVYGIPHDLKALVDQPCDPQGCTDDPRLVCVLTEDTAVVQRPAQVRMARRGDLVLTPADGDGVIGTILKNLGPHQFYDHMGIMVDDGNTIRHCTEAKDRLIGDKSYYTGSLFGDPAPTDGLRPDLVKYGWPGPILQTVQNGFFDGWNGGANPEWNYRGSSPAPTFAHGNAFFDYEHPETPVQISNLTYTPTYRDDHTGPLWPLLVRPPRPFEAARPWVRWALGQVAKEALAIRGHYRFYAYTDAHIAEDPSSFAPAANDPAWAGLAPGANWAAGTPGLVCSTFIWFAARRALTGLVPQIRLDQNTTSPTSGAARMQTVGMVLDGLYEYHEPERIASAEALHAWIVATVRHIVKQRADDALPGLTRIGIGAAAGAFAGAPWGLLGATLSPADATDIVVGLTEMPEHVANGVCNAFASDTPQRINEDAWRQPRIGKSVSPDDILNYWDAPAELSDERSGLWGESERLMLANPRPELVPRGRLQLSPGVSHVTGLVSYAGQPMVGAKVTIGCRTTYTNAHSGFSLDVPASPATGPGDQLVRVEGYWDSPPGIVSKNIRLPLPAGLLNLGRIDLDPPPEWRRRVELHGELMMKHQVMFGHDTIDHSAWSSSVFVQCEPLMHYYDPDAYRGEIRKTFSTATKWCGGERAKFSCIVSMFDPDAWRLDGDPAPTPPPEGPLAIFVRWWFGMVEGENENELDGQSGTLVVGPGQSGVISVSLSDGDVPPDRAHAEITVDNFVNPA